MNQKIEGTIVVEGLIEGQLPPFPDAQEKIMDWGRKGLGNRIPINVRVEGAHFSVLPDNAPVHVAGMVPDATAAIASSIHDLLRIFPPLERSHVFSTLRSMEYRPKEEIQTIYAVAQDGRPQIRQQTVEAVTVAPEKPIPTKELVTRAAVGLFVAAAIFGISALFIDYPKLWRQWTAKTEPINLAVHSPHFASYFQLEVLGLDKQNGTLQIKLNRSPLFPTTDAQLEALYANPPLPPPATSTAPASASAPATAQAPSTLRARLAVDALAKGYIQVEYFNDKSEFLAVAPLRIADLRTLPSISTTLPLPKNSSGAPIVPAVIRLIP